MARGNCGDCAKWLPVDTHGKGTATGHCTDPRIGQITRSIQGCGVYQKRETSSKELDMNVAWDAWERLKTGRDTRTLKGKPEQVPLDVLRERARKYGRKVA